MQSIIVGPLVFEPQLDGGYIYRGKGFDLTVTQRDQLWLLSLQSAHFHYTEKLYEVTPESLRVTLRLICSCVRLDSESFLRTIRDVGDSPSPTAESRVKDGNV